VTEWGMSERLGTVAYRVGEEHPFLGREMSSPRDYSEATAALIDDEVRALVQGAHAAARSLLQNHRDRLEKLVKALLAEETVGRERLAGLMGEDLAELPDGTPPALGLDLRGQLDGIREP